MTKRPIRIAHVLGKMNGGGVEQVVMNYYRNIDRNLVQFDFIVDEDSNRVPKDEIESLGGRVFFVPPYQSLTRYVRKIRNLCKQEQWQIMHSHINALSVFPLWAAKKEGVPVRIAHSHSTSGKGETIKNIIKYLLRTQANRFPTHRVACGEYAGKWLFGENESFRVIHNAIVLDRFEYNEDVRSSLRRELGISDEAFVVGHIGRFMPQKNHAFLIEAFNRMCSYDENAILLLVGEGELKGEVEYQVKELGIEENVRFLGQRSDANDLYKVFDAFALPSLYEGLGIVGVEAQYAGLPCVFSDAVPREVDLTGTVAFMPASDPEAWARALCDLKTKRRYVVKRDDFRLYDIDVEARKLIEFYQSILSGIGQDKSTCIQSQRAKVKVN